MEMNLGHVMIVLQCYRVLSNMGSKQNIFPLREGVRSLYLGSNLFRGPSAVGKPIKNTYQDFSDVFIVLFLSNVTLRESNFFM